MCRHGTRTDHREAAGRGPRRRHQVRPRSRTSHPSHPSRMSIRVVRASESSEHLSRPSIRVIHASESTEHPSRPSILVRASESSESSESSVKFLGGSHPSGVLFEGRCPRPRPPDADPPPPHPPLILLAPLLAQDASPRSVAHPRSPIPQTRRLGAESKVASSNRRPPPARSPIPKTPPLPCAAASRRADSDSLALTGAPLPVPQRHVGAGRRHQLHPPPAPPGACLLWGASIASWVRT